MQLLPEMEYDLKNYPLPAIFLDSLDEYLVAYDFVYLRDLHQTISDMSKSALIRAKYLGAWQMLRTRVPNLLYTLEKAAFNPSAIFEIDWTDPIGRVGTPRGFHG